MNALALTVLTTTDGEAKARALAAGAVEARLAACAQIAGPVTSVYRWQGNTETAQEWQVLLKTTADGYAALESWLLEAHDYDTPEIIATPVVRGAPRTWRGSRGRRAGPERHGPESPPARARRRPGHHDLPTRGRPPLTSKPAHGPTHRNQPTNSPTHSRTSPIRGRTSPIHGVTYAAAG